MITAARASKSLELTCLPCQSSGEGELFSPSCRPTWAGIFFHARLARLETPKNVIAFLKMKKIPQKGLYQHVSLTFFSRVRARVTIFFTIVGAVGVSASRHLGVA